MKLVQPLGQSRQSPMGGHDLTCPRLLSALGPVPSAEGMQVCHTGAVGTKGPEGSQQPEH